MITIRFRPEPMTSCALGRQKTTRTVSNCLPERTNKSSTRRNPYHGWGLTNRIRRCADSSSNAIRSRSWNWTHSAGREWYNRHFSTAWTGWSCPCGRWLRPAARWRGSWRALQHAVRGGHGDIPDNPSGKGIRVEVDRADGSGVQEGDEPEADVVRVQGELIGGTAFGDDFFHGRELGLVSPEGIGDHIDDGMVLNVPDDLKNKCSAFYRESKPSKPVC